MVAKKETILRKLVNIWNLNQSHSVGKTSKEIRQCEPEDFDEWKKYYLGNVKSEEELDEVGEKLYRKIQEEIVERITEEDCKEYIRELAVEKPYEGYEREKEIIKELLENKMDVEIEEAPDIFDRKYGVDFIIDVGGLIGLQIKPVKSEFKTEYDAEKYLREQHDRFLNEEGEEIFTIFSVKGENGKEIENKEVIAKIKRKIEELR
ncbi:MAG: MjaI family restriction endonuclease [Candidatus Nanohaloarchaea archaeon]